MITGQEIDLLRSIARAGEDSEEIKRLIATTAWEVDEDEPGRGYLRIFIRGASPEEYHQLIICYRDSERPPYSLLTFFHFPDSQEHIAAFDSCFHSIAEGLAWHLGAPTVSGERRSPHRAWPYAHRRWSLPEGEFTLVQDEFDIQSGLDVTLWIQPVGTPLEKTLNF